MLNGIKSKAVLALIEIPIEPSAKLPSHYGKELTWPLSL